MNEWKKAKVIGQIIFVYMVLFATIIVVAVIQTSIINHAMCL